MDLPEGVKNVVVVGGGVVGSELAYSLAYEQGKNVTIVEMLPDLMKGVVHANRSMLLWMMMGKGSPTNKQEDLLDKPIRAFTSSKVVKFEEGKVYIQANKKRKDPYTPWTTFDKNLDPDNTEELVINADYVIFVTGGKGDDSLYYKLLEENAAKDIYAVGDVRQPARVREAVDAANEVARFI